jgi:hypothetical protein
MAHDADHALGESPGNVRLRAIRGHRRASFHGYAGKRTRPWRPGVPETRGTTACCIKSKSSRFYIHPFREGNGRTQRVFLNRIARDAGWQLDWRGVRGEVNDQACRAASERQDLGPLRSMFDQIVMEATPESARDDAWHAAERARLSFPAGATRSPQSGPGAARAAVGDMPGDPHRTERGEG